MDPATGNVFVAWRQFAVGMPGQMGYQPNAINVVKVTGGGTTAGPVMAVQTLDSYTTPFAESFFDQVTTEGTFRTNAYPSLAIDGSGRVYLAWAQRMALNGDARIMLSTLRRHVLVRAVLRGQQPGRRRSEPEQLVSRAATSSCRR